MPYITKIIQKDSRERSTKKRQQRKTENSKTNICTKQKRKRKTRKTRLSKVIDTNK